MLLQSDNFLNDALLPERYTCDGESLSPELHWLDFPVETKSFALYCYDPDAPSGRFVHWQVVNIPVSITHLSEGAKLVSPMQAIENDYGQLDYGPPCPPSGTHHYIFVVYALDVAELSGLTPNNFLEQVEEHSLARVELTGLYSRN